jgi:peptidoglycan/LPS O-acetylase OafA/YrhL
MMEAIEKRVPGIDLLRGFCILAVVLHHINLRIRWDKLIGPAIGDVLFWNGYYGVRVFFVISGFLIAGWSLKRWGDLARINLRQFYTMRFARIVPCLVGLVAILVVLDRAGTPYFTIAQVRQFPGYALHPSLARAVFAALTFHINWLEARTGYLPAAWDVLWSLSVEEAFYIFFPLLCLVLRRTSLLVGVWVSFVLVGPVARVFLARNEIWADYGYLSCMDGIALGCLAAVVAAKVALTGQVRWILQVFGISVALFIACFRETSARIGFYKVGLDVTLLQLGIALLLIALQRQREGIVVGQEKWFSGVTREPSGLVRWFGRNSYEVYLTHALVMWPTVILFGRLHQPLRLAPLWFIAYTTVAGLVGALVARFYSEPLNRKIRARLKPKTVEAPRPEMAVG